MKLPAYEQDLEKLNQLAPGALRQFYPRRICCPLGYVDPKYYGLIAWGAAWGARMGPETANKSNNLVAINHFLNLSCPTYFIAPQFCAAINATNPPEDLTIEDMHFPMESMLLVLPLEFIQATYKWMIPFICVGRLPAGDHPIHPAVADTSHLQPGSVGCAGRMLSVHAPFFPEDGMGISYGAWYPLKMSIREITNPEDDRFSDDLGLQKNFYAERFSPEMAERLFKHDAPQPTKEEDKELPKKLTLLALKIVLAMTARPQLISTGVQTRKELTKKGEVVRDALWSPNFIGKDYRIQRQSGESLGGTHASPRVHWRRGHWHNVVHGKGRALRKLDWFEPVLVNAAGV